ncbi:PREDICTED: uncharacterized protein LOC104594184 [Nelumbo nucifera]|uniref:Uncharacterized protein LOC104594184 n=2 Tax=Nelumbo nucifera TaxID=4432 RepID=A0A1U7ZUL7_NELNU|nr:PREDICTED: uncharacterized protein LOC104594184 [Nelumbo nucifera]DAD23584.1 TPA_asm: hypothetical protein HUJ06_025047 [Nelumbo nucifera]
MWRLLAAMKQNLQNIRTSARVADESVLGGGDGAQFPMFAHDVERRRRGWNGLSVLCNIVRAPLSFLSCISNPHVNGADGVWVSGEFARISELNHLMVSDSMRYAILM